MLKFGCSYLGGQLPGVVSPRIVGFPGTDIQGVRYHWVRYFGVGYWKAGTLGPVYRWSGHQGVRYPWTDDTQGLGTSGVLGTRGFGYPEGGDGVGGATKG